MAIVSANTQARKEGYFRLEWKLADERSQLIAEGTPFVLPVIVDGTKERDALVPKSFLGVQWTWLPHGEVPPAFVTRVQRLLGVGSAPANAPTGAATGSPIAPAPAIEPEMRAARRSFPRIRWAIALPWALCVVVLIGVGWLGLTERPPAPAALPVRSSIDLPEGLHLTRATTGANRGPVRLDLAVSPDGALIAYSASPDGSLEKSSLYLRSLAAFQAVPIQGTEGASWPVFSPDGNWLGFWDGRQIKKWSVAQRGIPVPVADLPVAPVGIAWSPDGTIVAAREGRGLLRVDALGKVTQLTEVHIAKESGHVLPAFTSNGKSILFTVKHHTWGVKTHIEALSLENKQRKVVLESGADARMVAPGWLAFMNNGTLMAVPFDERALAITGTAAPLLQGVQQSHNAISSVANSGVGQFSVSSGGTLVYAPGGSYPDLQTRVAWVDQDGGSEPIPQLQSKPIMSVRVSRDGGKLAYRTVGANAEVWVLDLALGTSVRLTREGRAIHVAWTNDNQRVTFGYSRAGPSQIFWKQADGRGVAEPELLVGSEHAIYPSAWSPDDSRLLFVENHPQTAEDIWVFRRDGKGKSPLFNERFAENYPTISPDGRWLAYCSEETGRSEVYVTAMDAPVKGTPITTDGGLAPVWAADGRSIYYWKPGWRDLEEVSVDTGSRIVPSHRRKVCTFPTENVSSVRSYDLSADGRRFLIVGESEKPAIEITRLNLVQNWFEELKRALPDAR